MDENGNSCMGYEFDCMFSCSSFRTFKEVLSDYCSSFQCQDLHVRACVSVNVHVDALFIQFAIFPPL